MVDHKFWHNLVMKIIVFVTNKKNLIITVQKYINWLNKQEKVIINLQLIHSKIYYVSGLTIRVEIRVIQDMVGEDVYYNEEGYGKFLGEMFSSANKN